MKISHFDYIKTEGVWIGWKKKLSMEQNGVLYTDKSLGLKSKRERVNLIKGLIPSP